MMFPVRLAFLASASLLALASAAMAQDQPAGGDAADEAVVLEPITVDGQSETVMTSEGYVTGEARAATKTGTPLIEVPQSVSTVSEKQLDDRNPQTLLDALAYVPGARTGAYGFDPRFDAFFVRGFPATYTGRFRDGLREMNSPTAIFKTEPYGIEGITILKGPASALYGPASVGGLVDVISKRPLDEAFREVEVSYGSHDRKQVNVDLSGPANAEGTLLYRLTGVGRASGTEIEGFPDDRLYLAPAVTWRPDADTSLTVLGEVMDSRTGGTAAFENDGSDVTDIYSGDPRYNDFDQQQQRIGWEFEHRFDETFTVRQNARYAHIDNRLEYAYVVDPTTSPITRAAGLNAEEVHTVVLDNQLEARFDTGPVSHTLLVGADLGYVTYEQRNGFGAIPGEGTPPGLAFASAQDMLNAGVYVQDEMRFGNLALTLGARHDWLSAETETPDGAGGRSSTTEDDTDFSGRAGLSWRTDLGLVPYALYSTSFAPNVGILVDGTPARPTEGEQVEVGVKYQIPDTNAVITASLFDIRQTNGVVFDASSGVNEQVQLDLRSRGFEIEGAASFRNGLSLIASYAYVDLTIERGAAGTAGNRLSSVPHHTASLWADYTIPSGPAVGLGFGAGVRYVGASFGDDLNTFENDARVLVDAAVHYDLGGLDPDLEGTRLQVNATNLFDDREVTCTSGYCYREAGRSVIASLRYRW
ncbi:TonB-dependent siderophore receptor [Chthonobacter rhizosphaerae]|uniref:TonB-dependent siderophore receptor n=1 Tax=Chthonobacter rhizosphaerae TaxID=2735553 RepID=UPI0015EE44AF|nr:TonB-dependent siderophore receptor [Chthonobacter rhizosphaerae]